MTDDLDIRFHPKFFEAAGSKKQFGEHLTFGGGDSFPG